MSINSSCEEHIVQGHYSKGRGASCEAAESKRYRWHMHTLLSCLWNTPTAMHIITSLNFILDAQFARWLAVLRVVLVQHQYIDAPFHLLELQAWSFKGREQQRTKRVLLLS